MPLLETPAPPETAPLHEKSGVMLLALFQDFYRQELSAEEDVHRTLPFFATALGLIIAAINYAAGQLPSWPALVRGCPAGQGRFFDTLMLACDWPVLFAGALLAVASFLGVGVLALLALATRRRIYERVGPEHVHLERAQRLEEYYAQALDAGGELATRELRQQILQDFAAVIPINRRMTLARYTLRARAVALLLWSLLCALLATIVIGMASKAGLLHQGTA